MIKEIWIGNHWILGKIYKFPWQAYRPYTRYAVQIRIGHKCHTRHEFEVCYKNYNHKKPR